MAVRVISFPFRLDASGSIATVEQDSDADVEELLAIAALTVPGERILAPTFGINDPAFVGFQLGALQRHVNDFGPDVELTTVAVDRLSEGSEQVSIQWHRREDIREVPSS